MGDLPGAVSMEELQLATRNHGLPLEALRYPVTPVGLHYVLTHYDIPAIDVTTWRLVIDGLVAQPMTLSLADLRAMPATTRVLTMECAGNGRALLVPRPASQPWLVEAVGTGEWTGVALADVIAAAGLDRQAVEVVLTGADRGLEGGVAQAFQRSLPVNVATSDGVLLAYELNGAPLPPQHGSPLRAVVPGWYGMSNVKWLTTITAVDQPFDGYQQAVSYRRRAEESDIGEPLTRMAPRALMVPPGVPEFLSRLRTVPAGECELTGRAWSGAGAVTAVDVSIDGGATWHPAELDPPSHVGAWQAWRHRFRAEPGDHVLCCRATDAAGDRQPLTPAWNVGGYANNAVQRVAIQVR